jgi:hypothetical protein
MANNAKAPSSPMLSPLLLRTVVHATTVFATVRPPRHHLLLGCHCCCGLSSVLPPSTLFHEHARNGQQCQGAIVRATATIVIAHHCLRHCRDCHRARGQGTADNAKHHHPRHCHLLSVRTIVHAAAVIAITQKGEE